MTDKHNEPKLSKRAEKLYARLKEGRWYRAYANDTPAAMKELVDAGLVQIAARVNVSEACFVPTKGFRPMRREDWDRD